MTEAEKIKQEILDWIDQNRSQLPLNVDNWHINVNLKLRKREGEIVRGGAVKMLFLRNIQTADFLPCDNGTLTLYSAGIPLQDRNIY